MPNSLMRSGPMPRLFLLAMAIVLSCLFVTSAMGQSSVRPPDNAVTEAEPTPVPEIPGKPLGTESDSDLWRTVRQGGEGSISIPDGNAATLIQSPGEDWRQVRNGPLYDYLGMAMGATVVLLALFFAIRGRIKIDAGKSGVTIRRFTTIERMGHWLMATSFIILGITGLNLSYGRDIVMPIIGKDAFGPISNVMKAGHNYVAFAFILGLAIAFVCWVIHNIPNWADVKWLARGGGLFSKGVHIPAKKFNAGQKIIFWGTMLGGLSLTLSGWALMFPYDYFFFTDTFQMFAGLGIDVPGLLGLPATPYTPIQEQQFNTIWHAVVAIGMICMILAHIYIGSIGMQGAFDAMGSGDVDLNWAKEHHSLWVDEVKSKEGEGATTAPAE